MAPSTYDPKKQNQLENERGKYAPKGPMVGDVPSSARKLAYSDGNGGYWKNLGGYDGFTAFTSIAFMGMAMDGLSGGVCGKLPYWIFPFTSLWGVLVDGIIGGFFGALVTFWYKSTVVLFFVCLSMTAKFVTLFVRNFFFKTWMHVYKSRREAALKLAWDKDADLMIQFCPQTTEDWCRVPVNEADVESIKVMGQALFKLCVYTYVNPEVTPKGMQSLEWDEFRYGYDLASNGLFHDDVFWCIFTNQTKNEVVLAFRGTQADSFGQWLIEANTDFYEVRRPTVANVQGTSNIHRGFYQGWGQMRTSALTALVQAINQMKAKDPQAAQPQVVVTGHGMGAAFAQVAAWDLSNILDEQYKEPENFEWNMAAWGQLEKFNELLKMNVMLKLWTFSAPHALSPGLAQDLGNFLLGQSQEIQNAANATSVLFCHETDVVNYDPILSDQSARANVLRKANDLAPPSNFLHQSTHVPGLWVKDYTMPQPWMRVLNSVLPVFNHCTYLGVNTIPVSMLQ